MLYSLHIADQTEEIQTLRRGPLNRHTTSEIRHSDIASTSSEYGYGADIRDRVMEARDKVTPRARAQSISDAIATSLSHYKISSYKIPLMFIIKDIRTKVRYQNKSPISELKSNIKIEVQARKSVWRQNGSPTSEKKSNTRIEVPCQSRSSTS